MYNEKAANIGATIFFIGFNLLYFPMFIMGYLGMPRRYYDSLPEFQIYHTLSTVGSWVLIAGVLIMVITILIALFKGKKAEMNPWGGTTLEWTVPSPPPVENFDEIPTVTKGPYEHEYSDK